MRVPITPSRRPRRTQEERSAATRAKLLDATIDCLVDYGYNGTTTAKVAERAGVTRGAQLHHFGSRNDLVIAAVQHLAARRSAEAVEQVGAVRASADPLGALFDLLWDLHEGPLFIASLELWVASRTDPDLRVEVVKFEKMVSRSIAGAVAGVLPSGVDRDLLEFVYTAMDALRGILISGFVDPDSQRSRKCWDRACRDLRRSVDPALVEGLAADATAH